MKEVELDVLDMRTALKKVSWCIKLFDDVKYWTTDFAGMIEILKTWEGSRKPYIADRFDCDDFSRVFKCHCIDSYGFNAVGLVRDYPMRHAYNLFVTDDLKVYVIEPQTGTWWEFDERPKDRYLCKLALIMF